MFRTSLPSRNYLDLWNTPVNEGGLWPKKTVSSPMKTWNVKAIRHTRQQDPYVHVRVQLGCINAPAFLCIGGTVSGLTARRPDTSQRQLRWLPPCLLVILVPLKCYSRNEQFLHRMPFTEEEVHWCPCPFKKRSIQACAALFPDNHNILV